MVNILPKRSALFLRNTNLSCLDPSLKGLHYWPAVCLDVIHFAWLFSRHDTIIYSLSWQWCQIKSQLRASVWHTRVHVVSMDQSMLAERMSPRGTPQRQILRWNRRCWGADKSNGWRKRSVWNLVSFLRLQWPFYVDRDAGDPESAWTFVWRHRVHMGSLRVLQLLQLPLPRACVCVCTVFCDGLASHPRCSPASRSVFQGLPEDP